MSDEKIGTHCSSLGIAANDDFYIFVPKFIVNIKQVLYLWK